MTNEQRQQRKAAGRQGALKRRALHTSKELKESGQSANDLMFERQVLKQRPDVADEPAELERMALAARAKHMAMINAASVRARREKVIAKTTRSETCYQCEVLEGGRSIGPGVRITPCYRHMAQEMLKDPEYTPMRVLNTMLKVMQGVANDQRAALIALKDKIEHRDRDDQAS